MLIIGAGGFAKEVLETIPLKNFGFEICFYDDFTENCPDTIYDTFRVIKSESDAVDYFSRCSRAFTLGLGNPGLRRTLAKKFEELGGELTTTISAAAELGRFGVRIDKGCNILGGARISNDVVVGRGSIVYYNCVLTHDVVIGDYVEISPGAILLGKCKIGDSVQIGAGAIIFPKVEIGRNSIVGAGAVVRQHVPESCTVAGVPSKIINYH